MRRQFNYIQKQLFAQDDYEKRGVKMKLIDAHCHLYPEYYGEELDQIIKNARENDVFYMVNIGTDEETSKVAIDVAENHDGVFATVGLYPEFCNDDEVDLSFIEELIKNDTNHKIVAIGEIGLDYHGEGVNKENQKKHFVEQIELANKLNLPVCIHSRNADMDMLEVLKNNKISKGFVMHCFSSSLEIAKEIVKIGGFISFAGPITFKNARGLIDVVKFLPLEKIMVETDAPYMCPEPLRGKRNEPANVRFTAQKIAHFKEMSLEKFAEQVTKNTMDFYKIK